MRGEKGSEWDDDDENDDGGEGEERKGNEEGKKVVSREGKWESGKGRCAITGRRVLGGSNGLRRVLV